MSPNPHSPDVVGDEWFVVGQVGKRIAANAVGALFTPPAGTYDDVQALFANLSGSPVFLAQLLPVSGLLPQPVTTDTFVPNANGTVVNGGSFTGNYTDVDESAIGGDTTFVVSATQAPVGGNIATYEFNMSGFAAGRRPLVVRVTNIVILTGAGSVTVAGVLAVGGVAYLSELEVLGSIGPALTVTAEWTVNPATGSPWTAADVAALDAAGGGAGLLWTGTATLRQYIVSLQVDSVPELRKAIGTFSPLEGEVVTIAMAQPDGTDTFTLAAQPHLLVVTNPTGVGAASWKGATGLVAHPDFSFVPVTIDDSGLITIGDVADLSAPVFALTDATGAAVYGQPWSRLAQIHVNADVTVQQDVTLPDTQARGWHEYVALDGSLLTAQPLVSRLKRRSNDVQVGGDAVVTPFDVRDARRAPHDLVVPMAAAGVPAAAVQHYLDWSTLAESDADWALIAMGLDEAATELLSINQQNLEGGTTGWDVTAYSGSAIASSTAFAKDGTKSLAITTTGSTGQRGANTPLGLSGFVVVPGQLLLASVWLRSTVARTARLRILFHETSTSVVGADVVTPTGTFVQLVGSAVVPAAVAHVALAVELDGVVSGETHYADTFSLRRGSPLAGLASQVDFTRINGVVDHALHIPVLVGKARTSPTGLTVVTA